MYATRANAACLKHSLTFSGTGVGGGAAGGKPHAAAYDRTQAFWFSQKAGQLSSPIRPRISLMAACRSSASLVNSGSLQMTMLDGSFTPLHSNANALPAASNDIPVTRDASRMPISLPAPPLG